jgi:hypothetical protein
MPSHETFRKLRIFVACPGDVEDEKERLSKVIGSLQFDAAGHGFFLELQEWRQCVPDLKEPQEAIFKQLNPEAWDIFVAILWTRFGTPCGIYESGTNRELTGTEAEILKAIELSKEHEDRPRVLIYRSTRSPRSLNDLRGAQLEALEDFLQNCEAKGKHPAFVKSYEQPDDFERLVSEHLRKTFSTVDLEEVKRAQESQQDHLNVMLLVLPLLLPEPEQQHLMNLELGETLDYQGNHSLRTELRRLRSMGLLKKQAGRNIGDIRDNLKVDLSDYVCLTKAGKEWVKIIEKSRENLRETSG